MKMQASVLLLYASTETNPSMENFLIGTSSAMASWESLCFRHDSTSPNNSNPLFQFVTRYLFAKFILYQSSNKVYMPGGFTIILHSTQYNILQT
jgi:hypothetical protein